MSAAPDSGPDARLIRDVLAKTRDHHLISLFMAALLGTWFIASKRPLDTVWGKVEIGFIVLFALQFLTSLRAIVRARQGGAVAAAMAGDDMLAHVAGWPNIKLPEGRFPAYLRVGTTSGAHAKLRVSEKQLPRLVDALARRSPRATFVVSNIVPRGQAGAPDPGLTTTPPIAT